MFINLKEVAMPFLSSSAGEIKEHYTVLVIGSGYGGAIAASRLARAGQQVCVLERGREYQSGEYPDTESEALAEMQAELPAGHSGSRTGLYDFYVNPDVNVFVGCGLGGTSLINGSVAAKPEPRVFEDPAWPAVLREDLASLEEGFQRANEMLRPAQYPERYPDLPKLDALKQAASMLGQQCSRATIAVNFDAGLNHVGVEQHACMLCGDCVTGCNYGAKNTLIYNYLPDARNFGAEIYTRTAVRQIERKEGRWLVHYQTLETGCEGFDAPTRTVSADIVILAAGTLGSTEILLRSRAADLPMSAQLGKHFSGNGDVLGYSFGCAQEIRGVGYGHRDPRDMEAVGPCVTGAIDMRLRPALDEGIVIHEMVTPGAMAGLPPQALAKAGAALGKLDSGGLGEAINMEDEIEDLFLGPYETMANNTQAYLVTTHEGGSGQMLLDHDRLQIQWPHVGDQPIFEKVNAMLADATRALGGSYRINPVWSAIFNKDLITVHPLGGCVMGDDAAHGVVNHKGQVYCGESGTAVYDGLYVCDGSTIPRSLGAGPLLTISALSERTCALMAKDRGWQIDYSLPSRQRVAGKPEPMGLQFIEKARGSRLELDLTVVSDDLEQLMGNPDFEAAVGGTVIARELSSAPLRVVAGTFSLGRMAYRLTLAGPAGDIYHLNASKEPTAIHATLHSGDSQGPVLAEGNLAIAPRDLSAQLSTLRVWRAAGLAARSDAMMRAGRSLAGELYAIYGNVAGRRKKRPLRVNAPSVFALNSGSHLIRYEGGSRGPVLLAAGEGLSDTIFTLDTIETNLVEFLFGQGYDVWMLDGSDRVAEAAAKIKEATHAPAVQVLNENWHTGEPADLNAATRDSVPREWHDVALIGTNAARDVYPGIVKKLKQSSS